MSRTFADLAIVGAQIATLDPAGAAVLRGR